MDFAPASGAPFSLRHGAYRAEIAAVGASRGHRATTGVPLARADRDGFRAR